jgi:hypothetical protein
MESFFSTVKSEVRDRVETCGDAKMEPFDYIEVFYNQRCGIRRSARSVRRSDSRSVVKPITESDQAQEAFRIAQRLNPGATLR